MTRHAPAEKPASHRSGKLVVIAIFAMGIALGLVALMFRKPIPPRPPTQPADTLPLTAPSTLPQDRSLDFAE